MPALNTLPATAKIVLRPIHPPISAEAAAALIHAIDKLFSQFTRENRVAAHAAEVLAGGAVLAVAFVDDTPLSGCSHDKLGHILTAHEARTGSSMLNAPPIVIEVNGQPTCVDRTELRALIAAGQAGPDTIHWDLRLNTIGEWNVHGRRPAKNTWLAPLIARAQVS